MNVKIFKMAGLDINDPNSNCWLCVEKNDDGEMEVIGYMDIEYWIGHLLAKIEIANKMFKLNMDEDMIYELTHIKKEDMPRLIETYNKVTNCIGEDEVAA